MESFFNELPIVLDSYIPKHATNFINLQELADEQILGIADSFLAGALLLQKNYFDSKRFNNTIVRIIESLLPHLQERELRLIFVYIVENQKLNHVVFNEKIEQLSNQRKSHEFIRGINPEKGWKRKY